jgi:thiamine pyrophosphate-dependent acetolactate synthase large subunit-like protein
VLAAEATSTHSNFYVDQDALARAVGAVPARITSAEMAVAEAAAAARLALQQRRTVLLNLPLDVQALPAVEDAEAPPAAQDAMPLEPSADDTARLVDALRAARRPVFVAGRGARPDGYAAALEHLAERSGALLATSAVAKGLFRRHPWSLDVSGGFSSPVAAELIKGADLIVGWGCSLNMWTMRHGRLVGDGATVVQVDDTKDALGGQRDLTFGVLGDVGRTARLVDDALAGDGRNSPTEGVGYRTADVRERLDARREWQKEPYEDLSTGALIDPRTLTIALDGLLPAERVVAVDSGNFMGYPSMFLEVPDEFGLCFTQAFQSVGLGLATAIGAALARPDRLPVAALGDGGCLMAAAELDTVVRLGLPMVVAVYNDDAYGAEVHHFGPDGYPLDVVRFPPTDIAAVARGHGFTAVTVTQASDLDAVSRWLDGPRDTPLLIDAKVTADRPAWWLEEAFQGH